MSWSDTVRNRQRKKFQERLQQAMRRALKPPPKLTISEWADQYRQLSSESSAEAGRWSTKRAEYQRGMMDAVSNPKVETVVLMTAAQIGKTEIINNIVGFHIHQEPCPMLVVQPTLEMAQTWSKDRLAPAIRDTPVLHEKIGDPRSRDGGNTTLHKVFTGGHVTAAGSNSPVSLASRPCRLILCDEVDRYPISAGAEGDPVSLARKRATTFWNRKIVLVSTPTEKGASRIEQAYEESDQRKFFIECHDCKEMQTLEWANVQWSNNDPKTTKYICPHCGSCWNDADRYKAIRYGEWRSTADGDGKTAGFHLSALYSPWTSLEEIVRDFIASKRDPMRLKTWVNTTLGETWEDQGESLDEYDLMSRREDFGDELPEDVLVLTAGVDIQDDRAAVEIVGWAEGERSYSIFYDEFYGDPSTQDFWNVLDTALLQSFKHPLSGDMVIRASCVDSGGHYTQQVYNYCRSRAGRRIFAVKGIGGEGKPIVGRPTKNNIGKINLFPVGTDTAKELIFARLKIAEFGAGYCHFSTQNSDEYFRMLTSEKKVTRYFKGRPRREWIKIRQRNEALDCRVYATAAFGILNINIDAVAKQAQNRVQSDKMQPKRSPALPRRNSFVYGYK